MLVLDGDDDGEIGIVAVCCLVSRQTDELPRLDIGDDLRFSHQAKTFRNVSSD